MIENRRTNSLRIVGLSLIILLNFFVVLGLLFTCGWIGGGSGCVVVSKTLSFGWLTVFILGSLSLMCIPFLKSDARSRWRTLVSKIVLTWIIISTLISIVIIFNAL